MPLSHWNADDSGRSRTSRVRQGHRLVQKDMDHVPPTDHNLEMYTSNVGVENKLAKIGGDMEGGIIVETDETCTLEFAPGTLHAVFTLTGGLIGGINYSEVESIPMMGQL